MKLVIWPPVDDDRLARIRAAAPSLAIVNVTSTEPPIAELQVADALFGKLTPEMLAAAERLRWVQTPTASLEHYLFAELIEHPLALTNMRGLFSDVIADHVFGYILCFSRNLHHYVRNQLARRWAPCGGEQARSTFAAGPGVVSDIDRAHLHVADQTLGIVGLGAIGREVARRAAAFGMRILAVDPRTEEVPAGVEAVWPPAELPRLLEASDFVVIAAPHTPQTERLFDAEMIANIKPTAYLINVGRGAIVDLAALADALAGGRLAGAGLDVFETEPLPADHELWTIENAILTPHIAGCSPRIAERHLAVVVENVGRFVRGEPLLNVVDKRAWY